MDCFVCAQEEEAKTAVGACPKCGAALCLVHLSEQHEHRVGGMRYGCRHECGPLGGDGDSSRVQHRGSQR